MGIKPRASPRARGAVVAVLPGRIHFSAAERPVTVYFEERANCPDCRDDAPASGVPATRTSLLWMTAESSPGNYPTPPPLSPPPPRRRRLAPPQNAAICWPRRPPAL